MLKNGFHSLIKNYTSFSQYFYQRYQQPIIIFIKFFEKFKRIILMFI
jgi:hypothetical protein